MSWTREENILSHKLFGDKIIQNCIKTDATHLYDNDLLLRQETKKRLHVLEADIRTIKKPIDLMSLAQRMHFFTGRVPNDRHCACLSNKSLSY